ncbi:cell division protein FtsK [Micromonospora carbonacea]|uniref:FtsK/SpoIIIE family n=1 Tax=Micromonospora carbonacea TaxID=47853 RepID=A0A1C5A3C9_9ACTN|nr:cell division protein FtsK [Micromonospora carbonacea]SCF39727.1 FtsK/SpoIIIE family [Micromonospora carbonacea]
MTDQAHRGDLDQGEPHDTHYEIALDDEPDPPREPVYVDVVTRDDTRHPVIPAQWRGPDNIRATVKRKAEVTGHIAAYHAVRTPKYAALALLWSVVGVARLAGRQVRWWWVAEQEHLRQEAANRGDPDTWSRLTREARAIRLYRGMVLAGEGVLLLIALGLLAAAPGWVVLAAGGALVPVLAHYGRPKTMPIVQPAVVAHRYRKLSSDIVLRAYYAAGLGHPDKRDQQIQFGGPMSRDQRETGSQVLVDLPYGKSWSDVVNAKEKLASGLDVHENQVFLTRDKSSNRRHLLFVADRDPLAVPVGRTPLLDCKPRSIWRPVKFGKDERDRLVELSLMWTSVLVGAQPRKGKTFSARLLALHAALDPWVKLIVVDGKNSPDWDKFRLVAHRIIFGTHPNPRDNDPVGHLIAALREVLKHIDRVNQVLSQLPADVCPEGKLTEELARDPRYPDLRVWLLVMEEFQVYFETEDQDTNKEIAAMLSRILATGPSAGVILLSSSQKPSGVGAGDVGRLFNRYRDNHAARFALKCGNRIVSEAVLGGDAYAEGFDASSLPVGDEYRGVGYLYGVTDETPTVRTFLATHVDAERILRAARAHREHFGTLSGEAAGEEAAREARDVLNDVRNVFYAGKATISWPALAARLREVYPEAYADITPQAISAMVRKAGVAGKTVHDPEHFESGKGQGCDKAAVEAAIERRAIESR